MKNKIETFYNIVVPYSFNIPCFTRQQLQVLIYDETAHSLTLYDSGTNIIYSIKAPISFCASTCCVAEWQVCQLALVLHISGHFGTAALMLTVC